MATTAPLALSFPQPARSLTRNSRNNSFVETTYQTHHPSNSAFGGVTSAECKLQKKSKKKLSKKAGGNATPTERTHAHPRRDRQSAGCSRQGSEIYKYARKYSRNAALPGAGQIHPNIAKYMTHQCLRYLNQRRLDVGHVGRVHERCKAGPWHHPSGETEPQQAIERSQEPWKR